MGTERALEITVAGMRIVREDESTFARGCKAGAMVSKGWPLSRAGGTDSRGPATAAKERKMGSEIGAKGVVGLPVIEQALSAEREAELRDQYERLDEEDVQGTSAEMVEWERLCAALNLLTAAAVETITASGYEVESENGYDSKSRYLRVNRDSDPEGTDLATLRTYEIRISDHEQVGGVGGFNEMTQEHHWESDITLNIYDSLAENLDHLRCLLV